MSRSMRLAVSAVIVAMAAGIVVAVAALATAASTDDAFAVDDFHRRVVVGDDGALEISEDIAVTFHEPRRGLLRDVEPDGPAGAVTTHVLGVDRGGADEPFTVEPQEDGGTRIRIGDADVTHAPGPQDYRLDMRISGLLFRPQGRESSAQLRMDIPGDGWTTTITATELVVELPVPPSDVHCVAGGARATEPCRDVTVDGRVVIATMPPLGPGQTGTVAIEFPAAAITANLPVVDVTPLTKTSWSATRSLPLVGATVLLFLLAALPVALLEAFRAHSVYRDAVTDPHLHDRVTPTAELVPPDERRPAELAALLQRSMSSDVLLATIIDLQLRGAVTTIVDDDGSTVTVTPTRDSADDVADWEVACLNALCPGGRSTTFSGTFDKATATRAHAAQTAISEHTAALLRRGSPYAHAAGQHLRGARFALLAVCVIAAAITITAIGHRILGVPVAAAIATVIALLITWIALSAIWARARLPLNSRGRDVVARTAAFRHFLTEVHADRLTFAASQAHTGVIHPAVAMLPYAMAFGLADEWLERFDGLIRATARDGRAGTAVGPSPWFVQPATLTAATATYRASVTNPSSGGSGSFGSGGAGSGGGGGGGSSW